MEILQKYGKRCRKRKNLLEFFLRKDLQELLVVALGYTAAYLSVVVLHTTNINKSQALDSLNFLKM